MKCRIRRLELRVHTSAEEPIVPSLYKIVLLQADVVASF
jgi:hypothetical protein